APHPLAAHRKTATRNQGSVMFAGTPGNLLEVYQRVALNLHDDVDARGMGQDLQHPLPDRFLLRGAADVQTVPATGDSGGRVHRFDLGTQIATQDLDVALPDLPTLDDDFRKKTQKVF